MCWQEAEKGQASSCSPPIPCFAHLAYSGSPCSAEMCLPSCSNNLAFHLFFSQFKINIAHLQFGAKTNLRQKSVKPTPRLLNSRGCARMSQAVHCGATTLGVGAVQEQQAWTHAKKQLIFGMFYSSEVNMPNSSF